MSIKPDDKNPTAVGKTMKSGYGINEKVTASVYGNGEHTSLQNAVAYFPEFYYKTYWRLLEATSNNVLEFKKNMILSISLDTIYTKNFSKFSLLPHKYPRSVSGVDICAGASCGGTQCCMITPPFFSRRHAAYCRADSPIVPITHKVTPNKRF